MFGGSEGNTQSDVFRDSKHLMTSVIDGYNVCIFAYGQTGAGKVIKKLKGKCRKLRMDKDFFIV